jgi:predicted deacylase
VLETVNPDTLHGALICVPVLNMSAFEARSRVSPVDNLDVNRIFPGDPTTTYTPRLAYLVENMVTEQADILVDLHGGGNDFRVTWYTIFHDLDNEAGRLSRELSMVAGAPLVWASRQAWLENGLFTRLTRQGIAAMLVECGGEGRLYEENIQAHQTSLMNMLRHLKMIEGEADQQGERTLIRSLDFFHCKKGGFITAFVKPGDDIVNGQPLLSISDPFGREVETITSSSGNAVVIAVKTYGVTNGGAPVGQIAIKA